MCDERQQIIEMHKHMEQCRMMHYDVKKDYKPMTEGDLLREFSIQREKLMALPTVASERKDVPIYSGVLNYFPDALAAVAACSRQGNEQHNPGQPLHWDRSKSGDELDALTRHLMEAGTVDTDGIRHSTKLAWRALANLQKELEDVFSTK